ncbi:MAG: ATP-binding protein [Planctomycetota bacterium]
MTLLQVLIVTSLVAGASAAIVVACATEAQLRKQVENQLVDRAELYADILILDANVAAGREQIQRKVRTLASHRDVLELLVVGGDPMTVIGTSEQVRLGLPLEQVHERWRGRFDLEADLQAQHSLDAERREFFYTVPFALMNLNDPALRSTPSHRIPGVVLVRLDPTDFMTRAQAHHQQFALVVVGTVLWVLVLAVVTMTWHVLLPIRTLRRRLTERVEGQGDRTAPSLPSHDIHALGETVWSMFDVVERTNEHMRAIVTCATDAIVTIDRIGTIVQFNPGAENMFGIAAREALGTEVARFVPLDLRPAHTAGIRDVANGKKPQILGFAREVRGLRRDGSSFPCSLAVNATSLRGETYYVGILRDRTEDELARKALEEARQQAEVGSRTKSAFLANMSHEIRTPLTAILGYAEEIEQERLTADERGEALQIIQRNGQHLMTIINDILDLSKVEAGSMQLEKAVCSPVEIVREVQRIMLSRARSKGLALEVTFVEPMPAVIETDPTRLRQILLNLVGNAIKFTDEGSVTVEVATDFAASMLSIAIVDTGIGIKPEQQASLFQAFAQADSSISRKYGGTGLGLYISRRIAQVLGGDLTVQSEFGKGCRFCCTLATGPITPGAVSAATRIERKKVEVPKLTGRVLVVDDGLDNQKLIAKVVSATGLEVEVVENGAIAVERVLGADQAHGFDLVLMDMQMPVMDGPTATRALRDAGYQRPIVALTANVLPEDRERCEAAGCSHFAGKPIDRRKLYQLLSSVFGETSADSSTKPAN